VENIGKLVSSRTRVKVFLQILLSGPSSTTELAKQLGLPVANVSYHIKRLESDGFVEPVGAGGRPFKEKPYTISESFGNSLRPENLNSLLLESEASKIRNFIVGLLLVAGESLKTIGEKYSTEDPFSFVEKFLFEGRGFVGTIPISLVEKEDFVRELRELVVRHLSAIPLNSKSDRDALVIVGVLPLDAPAAKKNG